MAKLNAEKGELMKPLDRPKVFGVPQIVELNPNPPKGQETLRVNGATLCAAALATMDVFCQSADDTVQPSHVRHNNLPLTQRTDPKLDDGRRAYREYVAKLAQKMWDTDVMSPKGKLRYSHDFYLKIYAMSRPNIAAEQGIRGRAVLLFDEAQDSTDRDTDVALRQRGKMQVVVCGDSSQSIYRFRGSVDSLRAFADADNVRTHTLSQTFRFGADIALRANAALNRLPDSDVRIVPDMSKPSVVLHLPEDRVPRDEQLVELARNGKLDACVCRSNYDVLSVAMKLVAAGVKTFAEIDHRAVTNAANDWQRMARGERAYNQALRQFTDLDHLKRVINPPLGGGVPAPEDDLKNYDIDDVTVSVLRMISQFGATAVLHLLPSLVASERGADIALTTVHKAKGRQWERVAVLWAGNPFEVRGNVDPFSTSRADELMVWYVAATRAQHVLYLTADPVQTGCEHLADDTAKMMTAVCGAHLLESHPVAREVREKGIKGYQLSSALCFAHKMFSEARIDTRNGKLSLELLAEVGVENMLGARDIYDSGMPMQLVRCMTDLTDSVGMKKKFTDMFDWGK